MSRLQLTRVHAVILAAVTAFVSPLLTPALAEEPVPGLLIPTIGPASLPVLGRWVVRARPVSIDFRALERSTAPAGRIAIELFDGVVATAVLDRLQTNRSGSRSWIGHLAGHPESQIFLVARDQTLIGTIRVGSRTYQIEREAQGQHRLEEVDAALLPDEMPPHQPSVAELVTSRVDRAAGGVPDHDSGLFYDLLVVYTAQARDVAGGTKAIESRIELGVAETNLSYERSQVRTRVHLVDMQEISYTETGDAQIDRNRLQSPTDGFMDGAHTQRDALGADIVSLIISSPGCGISYIQNPVSPNFAAFGFSVTMYACISPNYTFAHEIGHLQSARHDRFVDPTNNGPWAFNHGYYPPTQDWRTIMAYSNGCGGCSRQLWWSNPNVLYPPTGQAMGIPDGQPNAADNAQALNRSAFTVANFRVSQNEIFGDSFETGDTSRWDVVSPP